MDPTKYLECEVFLTGRDQARLSVSGRDYSGRPVLDEALERRLLEWTLDPVHYGTALFEALFVVGEGNLLTGYQESLALARHGGQCLRLSLHVAATAPRRLHDLHWELLYDPVRRLAFGRSQEIVFCRYLGVAFEPGTSVVGQPRLLVVMSSPRDLGDYGLPAGDEKGQRQSLEEALVPLAEKVDYEFLEAPATVERIRDRLVDGKFHALHLQAHGVLHPEQAMASVVLENNERRSVFIEERIFAEVFEGLTELRLATLIACHSGTATGVDPFSGLGPALVRQSIPAVVAMRRQITLETASQFSKHLYRNLARSGQIDVAVNESRRQLYLADPESPDWGTPALFMHLRSGQLWEARTDGAGADSRARDEATAEGAGEDAVLRTMLVGRWSTSRGSNPPTELRQRQERLVRDLLTAHGGQELGQGEGFVALFERPIQAVQYTVACHRALATQAEEGETALGFGVGIHLGEIFLHENREAKGPIWEITTRLAQIAREGQTLLTRVAFDVARQGSIEEATEVESMLWLAHGEYLFEGLEGSLEIFEAGVEGSAPLEAPPESSAASRTPGQDTIPGWRPAPGLTLPQRPHWTMERKLGTGGFGEVWRATHRKTGEHRVFKFCYEASRLPALQRAITLFRLLKEELGTREDIARILDWNFEEAPYFIESESAVHGNLLEWVEARGGIDAIPLDQRLEIVAQVATALAAAHSVGVLHKDVKPANVLIAEDSEGAPRVRLCDFGIGAVIERERLAAAGITVLGMTTQDEETASSPSGTRLYMAPEILEGKRATLQADIYALGVVLYQMVVGDFSRALAPGWRRGVDDALLRDDIAAVVDGSPDQRLRDASRLADRLRSLEERRRKYEEDVREREAAQLALESLARSRSRNRWVAAAMAVLVVFAAGMAFESTRSKRDAERANAMVDFLEEIFKAADPQKSQPPTLEELLDQGAEKIHLELEGQPLAQARLMETIGNTYTSLGKYESAEPLLTESLDIREAALGEFHLQTASSAASLAILYSEQGRYTDAEPLYRKSLRIREELLGPDHPQVVQSVNDLGTLYWDQSLYTEAETLFLRALEIRDQGEASNPQDLTQSLNNLANLLVVQGRLEEAEPLFLRALGIREETLGPDHALVASSLNNLASIYWGQGEIEKARANYERALNIWREALGPNHRQVAVGLSNLAALKWLSEDYSSAETLYRQALAIQETALESDHPEIGLTLQCLAELAWHQGQYKDSEILYLRALGILEKKLDPENLDIGYALAGLATLYRDQERFNEAVPHYLRALAIQEKRLGAGATDWRETAEDYILLLERMGRLDEVTEWKGRLKSTQ